MRANWEVFSHPLGARPENLECPQHPAAYVHHANMFASSPSRSHCNDMDAGEADRFREWSLSCSPRVALHIFGVGVKFVLFQFPTKFDADA